MLTRIITLFVLAALNSKKQTKHGPMKKEQPHPLRNKKPKPEPPPPREKRNNVAAKKKPVPGATAKSKVNTGLKKDEKKPDPNMVTLTQTEFDAILETIGKLALETEGLKDTDTKHASGEGEQGNIDKTIGISFAVHNSKFV